MFTLTEEQLEKINEFIKNNRKPAGAIGGQFSYIFSPTSIGVVVKIRDDIGGKELDVTNYLDW